MSILLFSILEALAVLSLMTVRGAIKNGGTSDGNSVRFILVAISSVWWTVCFGLILVCEDFEVAYWLRNSSSNGNRQDHVHSVSGGKSHGRG